MPTGYTSEIQKGITFEKFILDCSKAFGALISMRDEASDAPYPTEIKPSDYHLLEWEKSQSDLIKYESMSIEDAEILCNDEYEAEVSRIKEAEKFDSDIKEKYEFMLEKVCSWRPPTKEHEGLKTFMIDQIEKSIEFDCGFKRQIPVKQPAHVWLLEKIKDSDRQVKYHFDEDQKEIQRCLEKTNWIQELLNSIKK